MVISKILLVSKVSEGSNFFKRGGGNFFQEGGGPNANSIDTHITCDFPGGPDLYPPLDPHMRVHNLFFLFQKETAVASQKIPL